MSKPNMSKVVNDSGPLAEPCSPQWSDNGDAPTPDQATDPALVKRLTDRMYDAIRGGVKKWGGSGSLAALWNVSETLVNNRLGRKEVNGGINYAFADFITISGTKPEAATGYLVAFVEMFAPIAMLHEEGREAVKALALRMLDALGYQPPTLKIKQKRSTDEKHRALVEALKKCGPLGEAAIKRAAADLGADPSEFDL